MLYIRAVFIESVFGFLTLLPAAALLVFPLGKGCLRHSPERLGHFPESPGRSPVPPAVRGAAACLFCFVLLSIFSATGISNASVYGFQANVNLIPFDDLRTNPVHYLLNITLFIPLGFLLPLLWKPFEKWYGTLLYGMGLSLAIETLQLFNHRATDIDDVLMNTTGAMAGYWLFLLLKKGFPGVSGFSAAGSARRRWEPYCCLCLTLMEMLFVQRLTGRWLLRLFY